MIDVELLPRKTAWEAHGKQSEKNLIAPGLYCIARARASDDLVLHGGQDRGGLVLRQRRKADGEAPPRRHRIAFASRNQISGIDSSARRARCCRRSVSKSSRCSRERAPDRHCPPPAGR